MFGVVPWACLWLLLSLTDSYKARLPSPSEVCLRLVDRQFYSALWGPLGVTLWVFLLAMFVGAIVGYLLGLWMGMSRLANNVLYWLFSGAKAVPVTVLIPFFIIAFSLTTFIYPLLIMPIMVTLAINVSNACRTVSAKRQAIIRLYGVAQGNYLFHIVMRETLEAVFPTLRMCATFCLALFVALDYFLESFGGLGYFIKQKYLAEQLEDMIGAIIVAAVLGIVVVAIIDGVSYGALKWKRDL